MNRHKIKHWLIEFPFRCSFDIYTKKAPFAFAPFDLLRRQPYWFTLYQYKKSRKRLACNVFDTFPTHSALFVTSLIQTARDNMAALMVVLLWLPNVMPHKKLSESSSYSIPTNRASDAPSLPFLSTSQHNVQSTSLQETCTNKTFPKKTFRTASSDCISMSHCPLKVKVLLFLNPLSPHPTHPPPHPTKNLNKCWLPASNTQKVKKKTVPQKWDGAKQLAHFQRVKVQC